MNVGRAPVLVATVAPVSFIASPPAAGSRAVRDKLAADRNYLIAASR